MEAVFAAPLSETLESGVPVLTTLEVADDEIVVVVPDVDEVVAVDPFFVPLALVVARVVAQRAAPVIVRAAVRYGQRAVAAARPHVQRATQAARDQYSYLREQAYLRAQQAQRALAWAQAQAASTARALRAAVEHRARQLAAQAQRARELAAAQVRAVQAKAREIASRALAAARAKAAAVEQRARAAARVAIQTSKAVLTTTLRRQTLTGQPVSLRVGPVADLVAGGLVDVANNELKNYVLDRLLGPETAACAQATGFGTGAPSAASAVDAYYLLRDMQQCVSSQSPQDGQPSAGERVREAHLQAATTAERRSLRFPTAPAAAPLQATLAQTVSPPRLRGGEQAYALLAFRNDGPEVSLSTASVRVPDGMPWAVSGLLAGDRTRLRLVDENDDGLWSHTEYARALVELRVPSAGATSRDVDFAVDTGHAVISSTARIRLRVADSLPPEAPTAVKPGSGSDGSSLVTWNAPSAPAGVVVDRYEVQREGDDAFRPTTATSLTWTGLSNGTTYRFRVRACGDAGCSPWSAYATGRPYRAPSTPGRPSVSSQHNALRLTWGAPNNGGSAITRYEVQGGRTGSSTATSWTAALGQDGGHKSFQVRACNAAGCGGWSTASTPARATVLSVTRGGRARYGYWYDARVYGSPGARLTLRCNDGVDRGFWTQAVTLDGSGYYRDSTLCYSGDRGPYWVDAGGLRSNNM